MGRPETISCKRCNSDVAVKARGPVPSFCADCRKATRRSAAPRPSHIACQECGAQVAVKARGPLPKTCRGGCAPAPPRDVTPVTVAENPSTVAVVKRPWDWSQPAATSKVSTATTAVRAPNERNGQTQTPALEGAAVTRMDSTHPATVVGTQDLGRRIRVQQLRQAAAIGLWLAVIALIALVVFIGSQPARPDF